LIRSRTHATARFVPLARVIGQHAARNPLGTAFVCGSRQLSWAELDRRVDAVAAWLTDRGLRRGQAVAAVLGDPLQLVTALFGTVRAGGAFAPFAARLEAGALARMLEDCRPACLLADRNTPARARIAACSSVRRIVSGRKRRGIGGGRGEPVIGPRNQFSIVYTSGSTGRPKGVVHSHAARYSSARRDVEHFRLDRRSVALVATPLHTSMAWSVILPVVLAGGTSVLVAAFGTSAVTEALRAWDVTLMKLVPTQYAMLLEDPALPRGRLRRVRHLLYGGAPAAKALRARLQRSFPASAAEVYGASECGPIAYAPSTAADSAAVPFAGVRIRILDERGVPLPAGCSGAVAVSSPGLMLRYHRNPERTRKALWADPKSARRYCRVGDRGRLDRRGRLHLAGRADEVMISGGFNVDAADIRCVLLKHADVADAAVLPVPQRHLGCVPVAFVVLRSGSRTPAAAICAWANERLSWYQRLQWVRRLERLPVDAGGKLAGSELERMSRCNRHG
jgi:acyl-CoA synthetase (AMP-forming)/AMP-acid ligase II